MAIGPKELEAFSSDEQKELELLEDFIDHALPRSEDENPRISFRLTFVVREGKIRKEIASRYLAAGWVDVKFHDDQGGGATIQFFRPIPSVP